MDSASHIDTQSQPDVELHAPVKVVDRRRRRDWLSTAWTGVFGIYAAAVVPIVGVAIFQAF